MKTIHTRGSIDPRWGYFYDLDTSDPDPEEFDELKVDGKVASTHPGDEERGLVFKRIANQKIFFGYCCRLAPYATTRCRYDYERGEEIAPIAWVPMSGDFFCVKDLAMQLLTSGLVGISVERAELASPEATRDDWYHVSGRGRSAIMRSHCEPSPYKCWKCGKEPLCSDCGARPPRCPHCNNDDYYVPECHWKGSSDSRLVLVDETAHPYSAIDPSLWDGADYFHGTMTHRMLQLLLRVHAHPFRAIPVPVNVFKVSRKDLERLETARTPLPVRDR